jgi:hypothetical protein
VDIAHATSKAHLASAGSSAGSAHNILLSVAIKSKSGLSAAPNVDLDDLFD